VEYDYDNLVLACRACNGSKAAKYLPSPEIVAYDDCLYVDSDGEIHAKDELGVTIIEALQLNGSDYTYMRRRVLETISEARIGSKTLNWCLGFPEELPDLSLEKKQKGNKRPKGIRESHYERKRRGELPPYF
jgi:hypothetical protein